MNQDYLQQARRLEQLRSAQTSPLLFSAGTSSQEGYQHLGGYGGLAPEEQPLADPLIYPGVYAPSGFNILDILVKIHTRPNPTINIGKIDHGVALTVCDFDAPDLPIVYCSEPFETLTGYHSSEVLGRNCRFLQHPPPPSPSPSLPFDGGGGGGGGKKKKAIAISSKDSKINDAARKELREKIRNGEEASVQLVNFRRDGRKFLNVLTIIPITWDGGRRYIVGFQADAKSAFV